ncbi:ABC transporter ATP-binding protein [Caulobacter sp. S45]|uniref:ABC transporter ATP-binding protein n=1 Tax=Caulobacter sp. S45 TaxID=1641861 RepID=UPI00131B21BD|nr:ABC transporter ATP-binding protein [Caulobacter sp. S45]
MLSFAGVEKAYGGDGARTVVLRDVTFEIGSGEFCAIIGPSGSGKSTLMNLIGLLDRPTAGRVFLNGIDVSAASATQAAEIRNRTVGFVFQSFQLLPRLRAWENVALPLLYRGVAKADRRAPAHDMLRRVGLASHADHYPHTLSGGQRQRVAIARALVGEPRLILADEPTGSLDSRTAGDVLDLFQALNRSLDVTIIMVTHDQAIAARCDRQIEILDGRLVRDTRRGDA